VFCACLCRYAATSVQVRSVVTLGLPFAEQTLALFSTFFYVFYVVNRTPCSTLATTLPTHVNDAGIAGAPTMLACVLSGIRDV